tara:strand:- start:5626 stop:6549 length:924 start_codon:yes stop_codon:yes gene_type:complete
MTCLIEFPATWSTSNHFESTLQQSGDPLREPDMHVEVRVPSGCFIMVDAGVRLLSYLNVLAHINKAVVLDFEDGEEGTMGYLDRMGFFECLNPRVEVRPSRPAFSRAELYRGSNQSLVEFAKIRLGARNQELPRMLVDSLLEKVGDTSSRSVLEQAVFTMFGELIDNIFRHSNTELDGFAVSQYYGGRRNEVFIAVSDSGEGPMKRLTPVLPKYYPDLVDATESELLVAMFTRGVSRLRKANKSGLAYAAHHALKFDASLDVRIPTTHIELRPATEGGYAAQGYVSSNLPLVWGTHVAFNFRLDALT